MSAKATFWVWEQEISNASRKLVLLKLADNANDKGQCWPAFSYIAKHTGMHRRTVMRHIDKLASEGYISIHKRRDKKNPKLNDTSIYTLNLFGSDKLSPPNDLSSDSGSLGVVTDCTRGSDTGSPGVVTEDHPEPNSKPKREPTLFDEAFELFWNAGMRKADRKNSEKKFLNLLKEKITSVDRKMTPMEFAKFLVADIRKRVRFKQQGFDKLLPTTYLNGERWCDELTMPSAQPSPPKPKVNDFSEFNREPTEEERRQSEERLREFQLAAEKNKSDDEAA